MLKLTKPEAKRWIGETLERMQGAKGPEFAAHLAQEYASAGIEIPASLPELLDEMVQDQNIVPS